MKIAINIKSKNKITPDIKREIITKLSNLTTDDFFSWKNDNLVAVSCANTDKHNKMLILLSLFTDYNYRKYGTFTDFSCADYNPIRFRGYDSSEKLEALNEFINSISDLSEVEIEIN